MPVVNEFTSHASREKRIQSIVSGQCILLPVGAHFVSYQSFELVILGRETALECSKTQTRRVIIAAEWSHGVRA